MASCLQAAPPVSPIDYRRAPCTSFKATVRS
jgi:hypothetical protein